MRSDIIIICELFIKMLDKLFEGRKPPDEIIVIARFKELNILISKIFKITKIPSVINEYNKKTNDRFFESLSREIPMLETLLVRDKNNLVKSLSKLRKAKKINNKIRK